MTETIGAQPGPQTQFLTSSADIVIYGGSAGGGKSFGLLLEGLRHVHRKGFEAVIFRRTFPQVTQSGGLWEKSLELYSQAGGRPISNKLMWRWAGSSLRFGHLQHETDKLQYQGAQIAFIGFDELTHFTESQFWYLFSRNRSTCGIRPYIRCTTNPEADSWVARLIAWWIDQDTGYAIPERSGVVRWFVRNSDDTLIWADSPEELREIAKHLFLENPDLIPKSLTFIRSTLDDNRALLKADPGYRSNLLAMNRVDRERLLNGNWKIRPSAGLYFKRRYFQPELETPPILTHIVRYWDRAATEAETEDHDPDWTVGSKVGITADKRIVILDVIRFRGSPAEVKATILATARRDGLGVRVALEKDPGSAGKFEIMEYTRALHGFNVTVYDKTLNKIATAGPFSSQAENRNVDIIKADWNPVFFDELEAFPDGKHDDIVDSVSGAYRVLTTTSNRREQGTGSSATWG